MGCSSCSRSGQAPACQVNEALCGTSSSSSSQKPTTPQVAHCDAPVPSAEQEEAASIDEVRPRPFDSAEFQLRMAAEETPGESPQPDSEPTKAYYLPFQIRGEPVLYWQDGDRYRYDASALGMSLPLSYRKSMSMEDKDDAWVAEDGGSVEGVVAETADGTKWLKVRTLQAPQNQDFVTEKEAEYVADERRSGEVLCEAKTHQIQEFLAEDETDVPDERKSGELLCAAKAPPTPDFLIAEETDVAAVADNPCASKSPRWSDEHFESFVCEWVLFHKNFKPDKSVLSEDSLKELHMANHELAEGDQVKVMEHFTSNNKESVQLRVGQIGVVRQIDEKGNAGVRFKEYSIRQWVKRKQFIKLQKIQGMAERLSPRFVRKPTVDPTNVADRFELATPPKTTAEVEGAPAVEVGWAQAPVVELVMKLDNMNHAELVSNPALVESFTACLKESVIASAGPGIKPEHVQIILSAGSVVATFKITPPSGVLASNVATMLDSKAISNHVFEQVKALPGIADVTTGQIHVAVTDAPKVVRPPSRADQVDEKTFVAQQAHSEPKRSRSKAAGDQPDALAKEQTKIDFVCDNIEQPIVLQKSSKRKASKNESIQKRNATKATHELPPASSTQEVEEPTNAEQEAEARRLRRSLLQLDNEAPKLKVGDRVQVRTGQVVEKDGKDCCKSLDFGIFTGCRVDDNGKEQCRFVWDRSGNKSCFDKDSWDEKCKFIREAHTMVVGDRVQARSYKELESAAGYTGLEYGTVRVVGEYFKTAECIKVVWDQSCRTTCHETATWNSTMKFIHQAMPPSHLTSYFTGAYLVGEPAASEELAKGGYYATYNHDFEINVFEHTGTGVNVWTQALDWSTSSDVRVAFHYTSELSFMTITNAHAKEDAAFACLHDHDGSFGLGIYATQIEPSQLQFIEAISYNKNGIRAFQESESPRKSGASSCMFCIPIIVNAHHFYDIRQMPTEEMVHGVAKDKHGRSTDTFDEEGTLSLGETVTDHVTLRLLLGWLLRAGRDVIVLPWVRSSKKIGHARSNLSKRLQRHVDWADLQHGRNSVHYAEAASELGDHLRRRGDSEKALELLWIAVDIFMDQQGDYCQTIGRTRHILGLLYEGVSKHVEAMEQLQLALRIRIQVFGDDHPDVAETRRCIALVHLHKMESGKALEQYFLAVDICIAHFGNSHRRVAQIRTTMAIAYKDQLDYLNALEQYQLVLDIIIALLGPRHPDVAQIRNNMANVHEDQSQHAEALEQYQLALDIWTANLGDRHPKIADVRTNIGLVYEHQRKFDEALEQFYIALDILRGYGETHPKVTEVLADIADTQCLKQADLEEGDEVTIVKPFKSNSKVPVVLRIGDVGIVHHSDTDGNALARFQTHGDQWIKKHNFSKLCKTTLLKRQTSPTNDRPEITVQGSSASGARPSRKKQRPNFEQQVPIFEREITGPIEEIAADSEDPHTHDIYVADSGNHASQKQLATMPNLDESEAKASQKQLATMPNLDESEAKASQKQLATMPNLDESEAKEKFEEKEKKDKKDKEDLEKKLAAERRKEKEDHDKREKWMSTFLQL